MSASLNDAEWALVSKVMDTVDSLQKQSAEPVDTAKVKALVVSTYENYGEPIDEALLDEAIAVATDDFAAVVKESGTTKPWWEVPPTSGAYALYSNLSAMEKAKSALAALSRHRLYSHTDLHALLKKAVVDVKRAQEDQRKRSLRRENIVCLVGIVGTLAAFVVHPLVGVGCFGFTLMAGLSVMSYGQKPGLEQARQEAEKALGLFEQNQATSDELKDFLGRMLGLKGVPFSGYNVKPIGIDAPEWGWVQRMARESPAIAKVWKQWLQSNLPFREGDYRVLYTAATAIEEAKKSLVPPQKNVGLKESSARKLLARELDRRS